MTVGERLKLARKAAKYTGESLGGIIGVSKAQISNIEKGVSDLTPANAIVLSDKLGIRLNWLLNGEGEMTEGKAPVQTLNQGKMKQGDNSFAGWGTQSNFTPQYNPQGLDLITTFEKEIEGLKRSLEDKDKIIAAKDETILQLKDTIEILKSKS